MLLHLARARTLSGKIIAAIESRAADALCEE